MTLLRSSSGGRALQHNSDGGAKKKAPRIREGLFN